MNPKVNPLNNENDALDYEDGGYYRKNVDRKGGQLNKVERKVDRNYYCPLNNKSVQQYSHK